MPATELCIVNRTIPTIYKYTLKQIIMFSYKHRTGFNSKREPLYAVCSTAQVLGGWFGSSGFTFLFTQANTWNKKDPSPYILSNTFNCHCGCKQCDFEVPHSISSIASHVSLQRKDSSMRSNLYNCGLGEWVLAPVVHRLDQPDNNKLSCCIWE